uniref:Uncharacterized protein n=1 Tax=Plectus sambesii TaxID=2011161 RepID=A0A914UP08_9BILA
MNALNFLRETPLDNWLDYFVDSKKIAALLEQRENNDSVTIARLLVQFVEQAEAVEKDVRVLTDKDFDDGTHIALSRVGNRYFCVQFRQHCV